MHSSQLGKLKNTSIARSKTGSSKKQKNTNNKILKKRFKISPLYSPNTRSLSNKVSNDESPTYITDETNPRKPIAPFPVEIAPEEAFLSNPTTKQSDPGHSDKIQPARESSFPESHVTFFQQLSASISGVNAHEPNHHVFIPACGTPRYHEEVENDGDIALKSVLFQRGFPRPTPRKQSRYLSSEEIELYLQAIMPNSMRRLWNKYSIPHPGFHLNNPATLRDLRKRQTALTSAQSAARAVAGMDDILPRSERMEFEKFFRIIQSFRSIDEDVKDQINENINDESYQKNELNTLRGLYTYDLSKLTLFQYRKFNLYMEKLTHIIANYETAFFTSIYITTAQNLRFQELLSKQQLKQPLTILETEEFTHLSEIVHVQRSLHFASQWRDTFESFEQFNQFSSLYRHFRNYSFALCAKLIEPTQRSAGEIFPTFVQEQYTQFHAAKNQKYEQKVKQNNFNPQQHDQSPTMMDPTNFKNETVFKIIDIDTPIDNDDILTFPIGQTQPKIKYIPTVPRFGFQRVPPPLSQYNLRTIAQFNEIISNTGDFGSSNVAKLWYSKLWTKFNKLNQDKVSGEEHVENGQNSDNLNIPPELIGWNDPLLLFNNDNTRTIRNTQVDAIAPLDYWYGGTDFPLEIPKVPQMKYYRNSRSRVSPLTIQRIHTRTRIEKTLNDQEKNDQNNLPESPHDINDDGGATTEHNIKPNPRTNNSRFSTLSGQSKAMLWTSDLTPEEKNRLFNIMSIDELDEYSALRVTKGRNYTLPESSQLRLMELRTKLNFFRGAKAFKRRINELYQQYSPAEQLAYLKIIKSSLFPTPSLSTPQQYTAPPHATTVFPTTESINDGHSLLQHQDTAVVKPIIVDSPVILTPNPRNKLPLYPDMSKQPTIHKITSGKQRAFYQRKTYPFPTSLGQVTALTGSQSPILIKNEQFLSRIRQFDPDSFMSPKLRHEFENYRAYLHQQRSLSNQSYRTLLQNSAQDGAGSDDENNGKNEPQPETIEPTATVDEDINPIDDELDDASTVIFDRPGQKGFHHKKNQIGLQIDSDSDGPLIEKPILSQPYEALQFQYNQYKRAELVINYVRSELDQGDSQLYKELTNLFNYTQLTRSVHHSFSAEQFRLKQLHDSLTDHFTNNSLYYQQFSPAERYVRILDDVGPMFQALENIFPTHSRVAFLTLSLAKLHNLSPDSLFSLSPSNIQGSGGLNYDELKNGVNFDQLAELAEKKKLFDQGVQILTSATAAMRALPPTYRFKIGNILDVLYQLSPNYQLSTKSLRTTDNTDNSPPKELPKLFAALSPDEQKLLPSIIPPQVLSAVGSTFSRAHTFLAANEVITNAKQMTPNDQARYNYLSSKRSFRNNMIGSGTEDPENNDEGKGKLVPIKQRLTKAENAEFDVLWTKYVHDRKLRELFEAIDVVQSSENQALKNRIRQRGLDGFISSIFYPTLSDDINTQVQSPQQSTSQPHSINATHLKQLQQLNVLPQRNIPVLKEKLKSAPRGQQSNLSTNSLTFSQKKLIEKIILQIPHYLPSLDEMLETDHFNNLLGDFNRMQNNQQVFFSIQLAQQFLQKSIQIDTKIAFNGVPKPQKSPKLTKIRSISQIELPSETIQELDLIMNVDQRRELLNTLSTTPHPSTLTSPPAMPDIHSQAFSRYKQARFERTYHELFKKEGFSPQISTTMLSLLRKLDTYLHEIGQSIFGESGEINPLSLKNTLEFCWTEEERETFIECRTKWNKLTQLTSSIGLPFDIDAQTDSKEVERRDYLSARGGYDGGGDTPTKLLTSFTVLNHKINVLGAKLACWGPESMTDEEKKQFKNLLVHSDEILTPQNDFLQTVEKNKSQLEADNMNENNIVQNLETDQFGKTSGEVQSSSASRLELIQLHTQAVEINRLLQKHKLRVKGTWSLPTALDIVSDTSRYPDESITLELSRIEPKSTSQTVEPVGISINSSTDEAISKVAGTESTKAIAKNKMAIKMVGPEAKAKKLTKIEQIAGKKPKKVAKEIAEKIVGDLNAKPAKVSKKMAATLAKDPKDAKLVKAPKKSAKGTRIKQEETVVEKKAIKSELKSKKATKTTEETQFEEPEKETQKKTKTVIPTLRKKDKVIEQIVKAVKKTANKVQTSPSKSIKIEKANVSSTTTKKTKK
jgi:hypothetical protein